MKSMAEALPSNSIDECSTGAFSNYMGLFEFDLIVLPFSTSEKRRNLSLRDVAR